ncbi:hypothetical protein HPB50_018747 [Hyalomma asiaticum]|uniref:Uncharacterized protein n=1 Tax=Hyalomma asiaticum TaxID=266040 RepID=A0ACB7S154_HYAAI|nr:hypothetical protein HPB50_018747 [Hyalomma asiaticum]
MLSSGESDMQSRDHSLDEMPGTGDGRAELLGISASASPSTTSPHKSVDPSSPPNPDNWSTPGREDLPSAEGITALGRWTAPPCRDKVCG